MGLTCALCLMVGKKMYNDAVTVVVGYAVCGPHLGRVAQGPLTSTTVLRCLACGAEFPWGEGAMERADAHERDATQADPEFRDHWVQMAPRRDVDDEDRAELADLLGADMVRKLLADDQG